MHLRRSFALTAGTVLLAGFLSSCGFDYATDQPYTYAAGTIHQDEATDVLNATIVAAQDDAGTFVAAIANNSREEELSLEQIRGAEGVQLEAEFEPVTVSPRGLVNLADTGDGGIPVTGDFAAGDMVPMTLVFGDGSTITMNVPVFTECHHYEGMDISDEHAAASPSPQAGAHSEDSRYSCEVPEGESSGH